LENDLITRTSPSGPKDVKKMKFIYYTETTADGRTLLYYYDDYNINSTSTGVMEINSNENI